MFLHSIVIEWLVWFITRRNDEEEREKEKHLKGEHSTIIAGEKAWLNGGTHFQPFAHENDNIVYAFKY